MGTKYSVIQSTMVKITILIFALLLIVYFFIAQIYWDREVLQREFMLLKAASAIEMQLKESYPDILNIKGTQSGSAEKTRMVHDLLANTLNNVARQNPDIVIGYYDHELSSLIYNSQGDNGRLLENISHEEIAAKIEQTGTTEFISDSQVYDWDRKGVIAVTVPVYYQDHVVGHTLAVISSNEILYNSYYDYAKIFAPSILLLIIVLQIINNSMSKIRSSLDMFSQMIVKNDLKNKEVLDLPELNPVYEKILSHLSELKLLNSRLEESNEKLTTIMEGISDGFFALDRNWNFTYVNEETNKIINKEPIDLLGRNILEEIPDFIGDDSLNNLRYALERNKPLHWEEQFFTEKRYFEYHAYPFAGGLTVFFRDITEIKKRESELLRLERLNLIGQMSAGISHEVRNPLTIVRGFLQMLASRDDSDQNKEYMDIMITEIDRANGILTDFLSLARANADSTRLENINEIISKIHPMLQADALISNKDVVTSLQDIPDLELNNSEIRQLILNLVRNGLDESSDGGKVYISTYPENDTVVLAIRDEGKGIPQEVQDQMGTPFITTKETGTGLGLAISIGIARRHNAKFEYKTGSEGTTFFIVFPLKDA